MGEPIDESREPFVSDATYLFVDVVEVDQKELRVPLELPLPGLIFHLLRHHVQEFLKDLVPDTVNVKSM